MTRIKHRPLLLVQLYTLILLCIAAATAMAEGPHDPDDPFTPGFSGYIQPMAGIVYSKSLSSVSDDNKRITSLDQDAESETQFSPMLLWGMGYTLKNESTRFFAGAPEENIIEGDFFLELGIQQKLGDGTVLSAAYIPGVADEDVWADPYKLGSDRSETDRESQAVRVAAESILGTPLTLQYGFGTQDIDKDDAGLYHFQQGLITRLEQETLKRAGDFHQVQATYAIPLGAQTLLQPGIVYTKASLDGDASSYDRIGGHVSLTTPLGPWHCFTTISVSRAAYDASNPVFDKTREDWTYGAIAGAAYAAPFGWKSVMFNLYTGMNRDESNIKFYDSSAAFAGIGVTWMF
ncbi:MAG TPA: hypothetical protein DHV36_04615 [Desulfobacteraceae bacterium]|nr:hypothetical protein [Desulfobacteraceae bacterium]